MDALYSISETKLSMRQHVNAQIKAGKFSSMREVAVRVGVSSSMMSQCLNMSSPTPIPFAVMVRFCKVTDMSILVLCPALKEVV